MRLKSFTAPDIQSAMQQVRQELGDDAIIVSSRQDGDGSGVRLVAAMEASQSSPTLSPFGFDDHLLNSPQGDFCAALKALLTAQGIPGALCQRLISLAAVPGRSNATMALASALDDVFRFAPLEVPTERSLIFVGPHGAGKTTIVAKLAVRAHRAGYTLKVISTDTVRAGAVEQLACFTRILNVELTVAGSLGALAHEVEAARDCDLVAIDTPGVNPRSEKDMAVLRETVKAVDAEPLLVMAAGGDPIESGDVASAFSMMSPRRLIATRLDMVKRLGGILGAAQVGRLRFADVSVSPSVASDIRPLNPVSLARMLIGGGDVSPRESKTSSPQVPL